MDDLREIIHTFDDEDKKEFRHFLNRIRQKSNRKDTALFDILSEEEEYKSKVVMHRLYKGENKEAYYALRKRLSEQLTDFVLLKSRAKDSTSVANILEYINLSQYLYDMKRDHLADKYLKKAYRLAKEADHYELLNGIYNLMIDKFNWEEEAQLEEMITEKKRNRKLLEQEENINQANSIIKFKLIEFQKSGETMDFDRILSQVFAEAGIGEASLLNPRNLYKLMNLVRGVIIAQKNFNSFSPFILKHYEALKEKEAFGEKSVFYQMGLLYFLSHTLYRSKRFGDAKKYMNEFASLLEGKGSSYYVYFRPRYMQLKAAIHVFCDELDESGACLDDLLADKKLNLTPSERLNITINKGINFFLAGDVESSHKVLMSIYHTDKWCEKIMGKEWVLKKNLMEVILYYDMDKIEVAESRIRSIERNYKDLLRSSVYSRAKTFIGLIKLYITRPFDVRTDDFYKVVEESIDWRPFEQEDLQAMGFYAWLKSKMQGRTLYEVWLELTIGKE